MMIKTILAPLVVARCMAKLGFVAGATAGTTAGVAGLAGLYALRRAMEARRAEKNVTSA